MTVQVDEVFVSEVNLHDTLPTDTAPSINLPASLGVTRAVRLSQLPEGLPQVESVVIAHEVDGGDGEVGDGLIDDDLDLQKSMGSPGQAGGDTLHLRRVGVAEAG